MESFLVHSTLPKEPLKKENFVEFVIVNIYLNFSKQSFYVNSKKKEKKKKTFLIILFWHLRKVVFYQCFQIEIPPVTIKTTLWLSEYSKSTLQQMGFLTIHILHPRSKPRARSWFMIWNITLAFRKLKDHNPNLRFLELQNWVLFFHLFEFSETLFQRTDAGINK